MDLTTGVPYWLVRDGLTALRTRGTGAQRQRRLHRQGAAPADIVHAIVAETTSA